jgi:hypothetical protein
MVAHDLVAPVSFLYYEPPGSESFKRSSKSIQILNYYKI